jgi:hypothetical protein
MKYLTSLIGLLLIVPHCATAQFPAFGEKDKHLILPSFGYYYRTCFDLLHGQPQLVETETTIIEPVNEDAEVWNGKETYSIDLLGRINWKQHTNLQTSYTLRTIFHYAGNSPVCIRQEMRSRVLQLTDEYEFDSLNLEVRQYTMQGELNNIDYLNDKYQILSSRSYAGGEIVGERSYYYADDAVFPDSVLWRSQPMADRHNFQRDIYHPLGLKLIDERKEYQNETLIREESIRYYYSDDSLLETVRLMQRGQEEGTRNIEIIFTYEAFDDRGNWTQRTIEAEGGIIRQQRTITYW